MHRLLDGELEAIPHSKSIEESVVTMSYCTVMANSDNTVSRKSCKGRSDVGLGSTPVRITANQPFFFINFLCKVDLGKRGLRIPNGLPNHLSRISEIYRVAQLDFSRIVCWTR
jgi:hypothetical protein